MPTLQIAPGQLLGKYRAVEYIASGGFAEVWSGWDIEANRLVALKVIPYTVGDHDQRKNFGHEASLIAQLNHPNIVPLYAYGETTTAHYLVMRYIMGKSLHQVIEQEAMPVHTTLSLMKQVARALDYVHERNIAHRDFKPSNILLDVDSIPYLSDFGLARTVAENNIHSAAGTLLFMPPEQLLGGDLTVFADQYSFGIVLFRLLTGQMPLGGTASFGLHQLKTKLELPDIAAIKPEFPPEVNVILRRLTALEVTSRPTSLTATMDALADLLEAGDRTVNLTDSSQPSTVKARTSRQTEIDTLIQQHLPLWQQGEFVLSLTKFVWLDILIGDWMPRMDQDFCALMLRAALEYRQQTDKWWEACTDAAKKRACFHALEMPQVEVWTEALKRISAANWGADLTPAQLTKLGSRLLPENEHTALILDVLTNTYPHAKPSQPKATQWQPSTATDQATDPLRKLDTPLSTLANSDGVLSQRAAQLIGMMGRTQAFGALKTTEARLTAFERAGGLPASTPLGERIELTLQLVFQQLTRQYAEALQLYLWSALGTSSALGWLIYQLFRSTEVISSRRILNTLGISLLFGLLYGLATWIGQVFATRVVILPRWLRTVVATALGGIIFAVAAMFFQTLVYDDALDFSVALLSGILLVGGFVISINEAPWFKILAGATGTSLALLIPWNLYLYDGTRAPFIFDENKPNEAIILTVVAAMILSVTVTLGWQTVYARMRHRVARRNMIMQDQGRHSAETSSP